MNIPESVEWTEPIVLILSGEYIYGEEDGNTTLQAQAICNRTRYLKYQLEQLDGRLDSLGDRVTVIEGVVSTNPVGCAGNCTGVCTGTCIGSCTGTCTGTCSDTCESKCSIDCGWVCQATCTGTCVEDCADGCRSKIG